MQTNFSESLRRTAAPKALMIVTGNVIHQSPASVLRLHLSLDFENPPQTLIHKFTKGIGNSFTKWDT